MGDFAKSQLQKFGWKEGKGLGKNEDGMVEALRPKLKFDTTGIGHRDTSGNQWWNMVFNKAASNINVDTSTENKPVFTVNSSNAVEIAAAKLNINIGDSKKSKDGLLYGNFVKTSTLDGNKETQSAKQKKQSAKEDNDKLMFKDFIIDDDKLFKACGGRTAHKGARHGLKLSGKLARIHQQEQDLSEQMTSLGDWNNEWTKVKTDKKCKKYKKTLQSSSDSIIIRNNNNNDNNNVDELQELRGDKGNDSKPIESVIDVIERQLNNEDNKYQSGSKKSMKKLKRKFEDLSEQLSSSLCFEETAESSNKIKKKKKKLDSDCLDENTEVNTKSGKKKKKRKEEITDSKILNHKISKKKKKKHKKKEEKAKLELVVSNNLTNLEEMAVDVSENLIKINTKKKKKSKK